MWYSVTLIAGIIILVISLFLLKEALVFLRTSERAIGTVIKLEKINNSDGDTFKPIFKFKTNLNQEIIYSHIASSNPPAWSIGEEATIAYNSNNPSSAKLLTYFGSFGYTIVVMAIAMPLIVIGGGYHIAQLYLK
jgi:hypothetical protein